MITRRIVSLVIVILMITSIYSVSQASSTFAYKGERYSCKDGRKSGVAVMLWAGRMHTKELQDLILPFYTTNVPLTYFEYLVITLPVYEKVIQTAKTAMREIFGGCNIPQTDEELEEALFNMEFETRYAIVQGTKKVYQEYLRVWLKINTK